MSKLSLIQDSQVRTSVSSSNLSSLLIAHCSHLSKAKKLEDDLFREYYKFVKPKLNQSEAVIVKYKAFLQQLVNVDVETQRVVLGEQLNNIIFQLFHSLWCRVL